jgi:hypothetical protein
MAQKLSDGMAPKSVRRTESSRSCSAPDVHRGDHVRRAGGAWTTLAGVLSIMPFQRTVASAKPGAASGVSRHRCGGSLGAIGFPVGQG